VQVFVQSSSRFELISKELCSQPECVRTILYLTKKYIVLRIFEVLKLLFQVGSSPVRCWIWSPRHGEISPQH
jgi:hypothetical protein